MIGHILGAATGCALAAGSAAAVAAAPDEIMRFAGVGFLAAGVGGAIGDVIGYLLGDRPGPTKGTVAGLTTFVVSGLTAAPMLLLAFLMLYERRFDMTPEVLGISAFDGLMASASGRLISALRMTEGSRRR